MSLLLEALKKAEKAKEEAQRRAKGEAAGTTTAEIRLELSEPAAEKTVITRSELPDIRQPLEILTEEIAPREPEAAPRTEAPAASATERAAARKVFEAKFKESNPRLPFYFALGILGAFAVGTVGYFWYQLRPPPPLVNANPAPSAQEVAAPAPESRPAPAAVAAPGAIPGLPGVAVAPKPEPAPTPTTPVVAAAPKPAPEPRITEPRSTGPRTAAPRAAPTRQLATPVGNTRPAPRVHPKVESAYAAYLAGDLATARSDYQTALREEGGNRDALLGLAAIDVRSGRLESAEGTYLRLLQADPRDAHAQAGLIALRANRLDPLATESRVKTLLAADPEAEALHFTLGNQLAQQERWAEAQAAYFKAFAADSENPDFAYNLAVSLDHLRQSKLALDYYRRAITLAEKRSASFDVENARTRVQQLAN
jgi:tetratricopeptide (TPR) repeat protein